jgi:hypothetical protein
VNPPETADECFFPPGGKVTRSQRLIDANRLMKGQKPLFGKTDIAQPEQLLLGLAGNHAGRFHQQALIAGMIKNR